MFYLECNVILAIRHQLSRSFRHWIPTFDCLSDGGRRHSPIWHLLGKPRLGKFYSALWFHIPGDNKSSHLSNTPHQCAFGLPDHSVTQNPDLGGDDWPEHRFLGWVASLVRTGDYVPFGWWFLRTVGCIVLPTIFATFPWSENKSRYLWQHDRSW
jgi:hypothetical protein